jgi:MerR family transcriptional regulator, mercuric resistance operon regulatory protein
LNSASFTIGQLAQDTGSNVETVRYYERIGLLAHPARTSGGRRVYVDTDVRRLGFIRRARELGFSIDEIRVLLTMADGSAACADIHALTVRHRDVVRSKISDLKRLERTLSNAAAQCSRNASPDCPVIDALYSPAGVG